MQLVKTLADYSVAGIETIGISIIVLVAFAATGYAVVQLAKNGSPKETFRDYRHALIRGTLVGLELLVAADIIRSVALEFNLESIGVLALLIIIRTFLSFTLEVELSGKWPWQHN